MVKNTLAKDPTARYYKKEGGEQKEYAVDSKTGEELALKQIYGLLRPGDSSGEEPRSHEAVECAYVLSGVLTVEVQDETFTLTPGEAITLNSVKPHRYSNRGDDETEFILSVTPPTP